MGKLSLDVMPYTEEQRQIISDFAIGFEAPLSIAKVTSETSEAWKTWATVENYDFGKDRGSLAYDSRP